MSRKDTRNRFLLMLVVATMLMLVATSYMEKPVSLSVSPQKEFKFRGKVVLSVPSPPYKQGPYYSGPLTTEEWIEQTEYIGADGISMHMSHFSNISIRESIKPALQEYRDAGLLTSLVWDSHGAPYYNLRFNPPLHYWSMDNQHKQGVHYWRVFIDSGSPEVKTFRYGLWHENELNDPTIVQNGDGSMTVKVTNLDYYTPAYGGGVTYNISSVYDQYSASEFSWLYDESGVSYDPRDTQYEQGNRLDYGLDYDIFVANNSLYAKVHTPNNREFNLYVLMYYPGHPSVVIPEGKDVYLDTYLNFLTSFSGLASAHVQNDGGFPVLTKEGDFHPEIIMQVEAKYGIDFNFDNWVVYQRAHYDWDLKHFTQYVFNRENYLVFKDYAREKQDMAHEYGMIYVPSGSDMFFMVEGMIEHVDALMVNTWDGWQHIVARWGHSGGNTAWTPTSTRLGIWETYFIWNTTSGNDIMRWTKAAADELLTWNPGGSTLYYWLGTSNNWNITDRLDDFKAAIQYFHERFRHVSMLPSNVERYTVAKAYPISYSYRYGNNIDLNPGQIDIDMVYAKDLRWDPVPTDGCLIPWGEGMIGLSQTDDMLAHEKIKQAVEGGSGIALSGVKLRRLEEYYEGTDIPSIYKNMFQSERWIHWSGSIEPHYLTFNGTLDPGQLNDTVGDGHWFQLEANSTANIIVGEHPYAGLYETTYGAGKVIGYGSSYDPFKQYLTDETSATYGDEYFVRLIEKAAGKEGSFRLWDVGKTYVYKQDDNTYYALLVERYGFSRNVPLTVYGAEHVRITDMDTGAEIPNNSTVHLEENSTKLFKIKLGVSSEPLDLDSDAGDGYVNLSWEAPLDIGGSAITRYNIYRNGTLVVYDFVSAGQLWYQDINVINGLTYTYNITAVNKIGEGPSSNNESATPMTLPNAPENLQADAGDGFVNLTWDPPPEDGGSSITGYNIYRTGTTGPYGTTTGETWFYDTGADNGITYTYDISAVNSVGEGPAVMISATPMTIPSAPENPQINAGDGIVYLTWEAPLDDGGSAITGYNIYRSDFPGIYATVPAGQLSYDDMNVINGVTYIYNISANNSVGEGPKTLDVNDVPMDMPSAPQNLLGDAGDGYVNLSWEVPSDNGGSPITGYNIYRNSTVGVYDTVPAGQLWFYDDDVTNGATYTYDVAAVNIIGEGADNSTSATPMTVPSAAQNLLATAENGYMVLTWGIPSDDGGSAVTGYNIYRDGMATVFDYVSATELSYDDNEVTEGVAYTYYVTANNIVGEGPLSNEADAKAGSGPAVPSRFIVSAGDSYVLLSWDIPASNGGYPVTNYTVYRGTTSGGESLLVIIGNDLSYTDTSALNDVTYYYRISATNDIAEGMPSNSVSATPQTPVIPVNEPPTSAITSPSHTDSLEGILDISGTSSDADGSVQRIEIKIDDGNWITVSGTTSWTYSLDTTQLSDGEHTITVRAYDGENYSAETEISVTVANPEEEEEAEPESPLLWIFIIIIVIVLVLVLLLAMRKERKL